MTSKPKPFDPNDDFDAVAETIRQHMVHIFQASLTEPLFARLEPARQIEAFVAGVLTGTVGVVLCQIDRAGHDEVIKWMADYLPQAHRQVSGIMGGNVH